MGGFRGFRGAAIESDESEQRTPRQQPAFEHCVSPETVDLRVTTPSGHRLTTRTEGHGADPDDPADLHPTVISGGLGHGCSPAPVAPARTTGTFTSPSDGEEVTGNSVTAKGTVENLSLHLLCIVQDESNNYFPCTAHSSGGQWTATCGVGPRDINRPLTFTLILATATQSAVDEINSRRQTDPGYNLHGMGPTLPAGIAELARVVIVRNS